jgi:hypothetical protein
VWVDLAGPGVDASGDGLSFVEALLTEPRGDREGTSSVVAEYEDGSFVVEFLMSATGDFIHGNELGTFDVRGVELPLFAAIEKEGSGGFSEESFGLFYGNFEIHARRIACAEA